MLSVIFVVVICYILLRYIIIFVSFFVVVAKNHIVGFATYFLYQILYLASAYVISGFRLSGLSN